MEKAIWLRLVHVSIVQIVSMLPLISTMPICPFPTTTHLHHHQLLPTHLPSYQKPSERDKMLRAIIKIIQRQYFRYTVMTGIYMLGHVESAILHTFLLLSLLLFINYAVSSYLFFCDLLKSSSFNSITYDQDQVVNIS